MPINSSTSMAKQPPITGYPTYILRHNCVLKNYQIVRSHDAAIHEKTYTTLPAADYARTKMDLGLLRFVPETRESLNKKVTRIV